MYLALGDNHAMSGDSRQFGFVPEDNLKGGVSFLFWPPGPRLGQPAQPAMSYFSFPNMTAWISFIVIMSCLSIYYRRKYFKPIQEYLQDYLP
jgi:signal peptidase I